MKKLFLATLALFTIGGLQAQTILSEDFETGNTGNAEQPVTVGSGWTVVNGYKGDNPHYNWYNYYKDATTQTGATISGNCCASVDGPMFFESEDGMGPREEILLSPELNLNDDYQLQFTFRVSPVNCGSQSPYDFQVRIVEGDNLAGAETIFSIQNEKMLRESGIMTYPITDWSPRTARVDLSDFRGEKVKIAFVYKMLAETANLVWLDDISVSKFTPSTAPVASVSLDRFNFGTMYIGEKHWTDVITLTNTGKDGLKITGIELPEGVGITLDPTTVNLDRYRQVDFQLSYTASMTSVAQGDAVIHTNGGDIKIALSANKQFVPEGLSLETFEGYFPPAGWVNNGWDWTANAFEGDHSVYNSGGFGATTLRSPRLDLTEGGKLTFTYFNAFDQEYSEYDPQYDISLQVSYDGGDNWTTKWTSSTSNLNQLLTQTVDLGYGDDNCYVRWYYPAVESDDDGAFEHSSFYLDCVLLPNLYGIDGVPTTAKVTRPGSGEENVYPRDLRIEWAPAQFAKGYKIYLGIESANDVLDGLDVGNVLAYTIPVVDYSTTYRLKVVGYNDKGEGSGSTVRFTTQKDVSVTDFPYEENFLEGELPTGWISTPSATYSRTWSVNSIYPYRNDGNEYGALASFWLDAGESNDVRTQEFLLPEDKMLEISFIWGNEHPASLVVDPTGAVKKQNTEPNNGVSECFFEIYSDGTWTTLSTLSDEHFDEDRKYWINEKCDLSDYRGKKVQFRWRHVSYSNKDDGSALTHVVIEEIANQKAFINKSGWDAGKVNYQKGANTGDLLTVINNGTDALVVKDASFGTPNFETSLKAGDRIETESILPFDITFNALDAAAPVSDKLTLTFESGYTLEFPVSGEALPASTLYYSFEPNELDYDWEKDFTMIDADNGVGYHFSSYWVYYSKDSQKSAFSAENDSKEHGMYGMLAPISGTWALVASSPQNASADNWIISRKFIATENSMFDFYARNWESLQSVLPDPKHRVSVLVSDKGNTDTADFEVVMRETEMPFLDASNWNHYEVDLSKYAGREIYVALRHTTIGASNLAFFDDFTFSGISTSGSGVEDIRTAPAADEEVEVYSFGGVFVAKGLASEVIPSLEKGFYIVTTTDKNNRRSFRLAK